MLCPIEFIDRDIDHHHSYVAFEIGVTLITLSVCLSVGQHFHFWTLARKCFVQSNSNLIGRKILIARLLSKLVYFRLFVCPLFVRLSVCQYFLCNPPIGASLTLLFMIVMYPSSGYKSLLSKIKILSINMINSHISGHTEDRKYPINACGVGEDMPGDIMTPELAQSCYIRYCFHPWCPDGRVVGKKFVRPVSQKP